jgi:uncharacterized membrane protein
MIVLVSAFALGLVAGLRTFTAPAALFLARGGILGIVLGVAALGELIGDKLPQIPSRTSPPALIARIVSGAIVGFLIVGTGGGLAVTGAVAGVAGSLVGAFVGRAARMAAIARIGPIPAALIEDVIAVGLAALVVTRQIGTAI